MLICKRLLFTDVTFFGAFIEKKFDSFINHTKTFNPERPASFSVTLSLKYSGVRFSIAYPVNKQIFQQVNTVSRLLPNTILQS